MAIDKPIIGQNNWGDELNAALDDLDERIVDLEDATTAADLVVPTAIKDSEGDDLITFSRTSTGTARIGTPQDDLSLRSARDITLIAGDDGPGNVYIGWGDATISPDATNRVATIADVTEATGLGDITFDGVQIIGAGTASGDGLDNGTIELVPDADLYAGDQYLVVDPTGPNHIHIRAGGEQDDSAADLILGGERTKVIVSDDERAVAVTSRPETVSNSYTNLSETNGAQFVALSSSDIQTLYTVNVGGTDYVVDGVTSIDEGIIGVTAGEAVFAADTSYTFTYEPDYENQWVFGSDGVLLGPSMGGLIVNGLTAPADTDLYIYASTDHDVFVSNGDTQALVGYRYFPQVDRSSDFTLELSHMGKHIYNTVDGQIEVTIPTNASVPFPIGTEIKLVNDSTASMLITRENTDTMVLIAEGQGYTNSDIVFWLPSDGVATLFKVGNNKWILSGLRVND
jgi:hypothetical protein